MAFDHVSYDNREDSFFLKLAQGVPAKQKDYNIAGVKVITDKDYRGKLQTVEVVNVKGAVHDAVENVERRVTGLFSSFMK